MRYVYATQEDKSNEDENKTSDEESNEISDHGVYIIMDELNGLNEEA